MSTWSIMSDPQNPIRDERSGGGSTRRAPGDDSQLVPPGGAANDTGADRRPTQQSAPSDPYTQTSADAQQGQYGQGQYQQTQYGQGQYQQGQYSEGQYGQVQYGQNQYGQNQYGQGQYQQGQYGQYPQGGYPAAGVYPPGQSAWGPLSGWGSRVGAYLLDNLISMAALILIIPGMILMIANTGSPGYIDSTTGTRVGETAGNSGLAALGMILTGLGYLAAFAIQLWNRTFKQGRTGQSIGKKVLGIKLVDERTGQPVGPGMSFVRDLAHVLDSLPMDIGYLWPLFDPKRQTFADKVMNTVVVDVPKS